ncbi:MULTISPECIES: YlmC/YmxH family sporulation protein [Sporomusa]|jgi:YlmC/YmxH family sporulation protein|uniref:Sporulation protein YlmC n=1 Tax=Sporomusa silvacetica DSM 10669 TaxID=1123289 RepID=A0ABZ3IKL6_9FIRM|nr:MULTISPECIES: YlmC/YmxH family sporulation protein [Sporomusa]OZC13473.1 PRC-barrel domain protein [Sporomusa silvacetica DSM 10669]TWH48658.1 YlmC/YmxH family sporulation protein [Sporomusa sp. KB1]
MRISEMTGKEVINLGDGARLGIVGECELTFDSYSGVIGGLILPKRKTVFNFLGDNQIVIIPWEAIKRIGDEVVIVDLNNAYERMYSS